MARTDNPILYKYRGLSNFEFAVDMILNSRLYAADFRRLNDPMEGRFIYSKNNFEKDRIRDVIGEKSEFAILSLSETPSNHLLWSYYGESHTGFVLGVKVIQSDNDIVKKVNYVDDFRIDDNNANAIDILTRKHAIWAHEKEHRVLRRKYGGNFVNVEITDLIFGQKTNEDNSKVKLLKDLTQKLHPEVNIRKIQRHEIENEIYEI